MGRSIKPQSNWYAYTRKLLSFFRVLKNLSLIWRHPIATLFTLLFVLLLFITPIQTIMRFFSPLIVCTLLCMVAFISFGSLLDKNENQTSHIQARDQLAGLDVLGLGEGWAPYNGFQSHSMFTQEGDLNFLNLEVKSKTCIQTKNEAFGVDRPEGDRTVKKELRLSSLKDSKAHVQIEDDFAGMDGQERDGDWASQTHDGLQSANCKLKEDCTLSSLAEPVMERESKTHVKFEDDIATMDEKGGDEDWASQMYDGVHSDTDRREEDCQATLTEEMKDSQSRVQIEDGYSYSTEERKEDKSHVQIEDNCAGLDERGQDREWNSQMYDGSQQDSNFKSEDGLSSVMEKTNEIETEIRTEEAAGTDVASDCNQEFHDCNFDHEGDPNQEICSEVLMEDKVNGMDVLDHDPNLAAHLYIVSQSDSNPKHENEFKQKIDSEVQMEDKINGMDVLGHDTNLDVESSNESQSDSNPKHESEFKQEIDSETHIGDKMNGMDVLGADPNLAVELFKESQSHSNPKNESEFKQEIDSEIQIGDKINGIDVLGHDKNLAAELDHELQSYNSSKQADDANQVPQKWRDWVKGVETDGLSIWTSEKDIFKNFDESTICTNFGQEITGSTTLEEEFTSNEAFISVDENGGVLLEELSSFIQELTVKLQSFQVEVGKPRDMNEFTDKKDTNPACPVNEATGLKFAGFSPRTVTLDDSNTEEGDASSRWDEALDTSEKESADSENEEESVWPLASDVSDLGATMTEKEFNNLKQEYSALEKEYKALQQEIRSKSSEQKAGTRQTGEDDEDSDDSLDPYVKLFAQCASDAEDEVPDLPHHAEQHRRLKFSRKTSKIENSSANTVRERSSLDTKRLFRKPMLSSISKAIRAIKGKKL